MAEEHRLAFLENRDGKDAAKEFAKRTMRMYRSAVLASRKRGFDKPHHASLPEYRRGFIESYCALKRYVASA
jgi:hypothetical protein